MKQGGLRGSNVPPRLPFLLSLLLLFSLLQRLLSLSLSSCRGAHCRKCPAGSARAELARSACDDGRGWLWLAVTAVGLSLDRSRVVSIISGGVLAETRAILGVEAWSRLEMGSGVFRLDLFLLYLHNIY